MFKFVAGLAATVISIILAPVLVAVVYPTGFQPDAACVSNARQIALAITSYAQDNDEFLPPMQSAAVFQNALGPFIAQNPKVFTCPDTGLGYVPNATLSNKGLSQFSNPYTIETFQDVQGHFRNGLKTVAYLDGHVDRGTVVQENVDQNTQCIDDVKQLALGVAIYTQDYDEKLPPMPTQAAFETELLPFVKNSLVFTCPVTAQPYAPNSSIGGESLAEFVNTSTVPVVQDSKAHPDGAVTVGYLDGHVSNPDSTNSVSCLSNIRQLALATEIYTQDYDDMLPPLDTPTHFQNAMTGYVHNQSEFVCPDTNLPYIINSALNGENLSNVDPGAWIVKDPTLNLDGSFNSASVSGGVNTTDYYVPSQLDTDSTGKPALAWYRSAGLTPAVDLWDLTSGGAELSNLNYSYDRSHYGGLIPPPLSVASVSSDARVLFWGSNDTASLNPIRVTNTDKTGSIISTTQDGPYDGWAPVLAADGGFAVSRLLLRHYDGACALWYVNADGTYGGNIALNPNLNENPVSMAEGSDGVVHILFSQKNGPYRLWTISAKNVVTGQEVFAVAANQSLVNVSTGPDKLVRLLVSDGNGNAEIWKLDSQGNVIATTMISERSAWTPSQVGVDSNGDYLVLWKEVGDVGKIQKVTSSGSVVYDQTYNPFM